MAEEFVRKRREERRMLSILFPKDLYYIKAPSIFIVSNRGQTFVRRTLGTKSTKTPCDPTVNKEADVGKGAKTCGSPNMCHGEDLARESKSQKLEFAVQNRASVAALPVDSTNGFISNSET